MNAVFVSFCERHDRNSEPAELKATTLQRSRES
jgi:hypothetical protein